jgi:hypothetical protein
MDYIITLIYVFIVLYRPQDYVAPLRDVALVDIVVPFALISLALSFLLGRKMLCWKTTQPYMVLGIWFMMVMSWVAKTHATEVSLTFQYFARIAIPYLLIVVTVDSKPKLYGFLALVAGFIVLFTVHGYMQYFTGYGLGGHPCYAYGTPAMRLSARGPYGGPNELSTLYAMGVVACLAGIRAVLPNIIKAIPLAALVPLFFMPMWWTQSRQALVALAAGAGVSFAPKRVFNSWWAMLIAIGIFFGTAQLHGRWAVSLTEDKSVRRRATALTAGVRVWKRNPVFGVGRFRAYDAAGVKMPLHNSYVIMLAENGFPGLLCYVTLTGLTIFQLYYLVRLRPETQEDKRNVLLARFVMSGIAASMAAAYFQNRPYHLDSYIYFACGNCFVFLMIEKYPKLLPKYFYFSWFWRRGFLWMTGATLGVIVMIHLTSKLFFMM